MVRLIDWRSEHTHRTVALELVDPAALRTYAGDGGCEEVVQHGDHVSRASFPSHHRRADDVDEEGGHVARFASGPRPRGEGPRRDVGTDVPAEEIGEALPLAQSRDHLVE